ncbi:hypothetical protein B9Z43_01290 [Limnohabitans sp. MMS-10A-192]|uniref:hypothetical protein n=1 Tax=Limnohabitans sp. MMS-10A-192 TaxID=1835769 RepID=UPI000D39B275|nr:hypothetical protein [Limnohabitans sp. MMS-10A-192]PUE21844.1 hypothetical protein B9Z43_01290 [Limnohabitans sp. MMS-10A-192]
MNVKTENRAPARVAKVKRAIQKYPQPERQGEYMRRNMRHLAKWMLITIGVLMGTVAVAMIQDVVA